MKSVMSHNFSRIPQANIPRSSFDRSHSIKTAFNSGYLVPIFVDEALPGDDINLRMTCFGRLAPAVVPVMDNVYLDTFFFAVPYRLVWENWARFNGEQDDPDDTTDFEIPYMDAPASTGHLIGSLSDYLTVPTGIADLRHSCLWHRAYTLIWNLWIRDQNMQDSIPIDLGDGPDLPSEHTLLRRGKRHDYFTSCLPWAQKGPALELPVSGTAPVVYGWDDSAVPQWIKTSTGDPLTGSIAASASPVGRNEAGTEPAQYDPDGTLSVNLSAGNIGTINALRQSVAIQTLYEQDARGGTRLQEVVKSHFGVTGDDARLQRPEYLGGGRVNVNFHPIAQTSETTGGSPQGNLAATGVVSGGAGGFTKGFTEHCLLLGLACVSADLNYQQGLNRMFSRSTRWDFYWPLLGGIGEQAVLNKEIYAQGPAVTDGPDIVDDQVFGYQERYAEYRYKPSVITGKLRSTATGSLDVWHLAEDFSALPELDAAFIETNPPLDRVLAVDDEPQFIFDAYFRMKHARPMPTYSVPGVGLRL